ncbi:erg26, C-3 sterol dehydrogenase [Saitoella coloradoensis]
MDMPDQLQFGRSLRSEFYFDDNYISLNHGSYGTYPHPVGDAYKKIQCEAESRPDLFFRRRYPKELVQSRQALSTLLNCPVDELVLVPNATSGVNAVLRSLHWERGDKVLYMSTIYGACERALVYIADTRGVELVRLDVTYPLSDNAVMNIVKKSLDLHKGTIKLALIDAVSSMPAVRVPWERLCAVFREYDVLSLVDGAHAIGQIPVDLEATSPDFFVTNAHKWLYCPRGLAAFHVPKRHQHLIHPVQISHGYVSPSTSSLYTPIASGNPSMFLNEFEWPGTQDFAGYLTIPAAIEYRMKLGGEEKIMEYCNGLAKQGGRRVAETWGTETMECEGADLATAMINVQLPLSDDIGTNSTKAERVVQGIYDAMLERNCFAPVFRHGGRWWVRFSAQVYNDITDFEYVAGVLAELCEMARKGKLGGPREEEVETAKKTDRDE